MIRWPIAGSQYHWTYELAPSNSKRFLSWLVGWISVFGWHASAASSSYLLGTLIQGIIILNNPTYMPALYHGTLIMFAGLAFCAFLNAFLVKYLPHLEGIVLITHICGFFCEFIPCACSITGEESRGIIPPAAQPLQQKVMAIREPLWLTQGSI